MKGKFDSVQMMRGLAAMSVVFVHVPMVERGNFGVDLFFCISGFIMMLVTERDPRAFLLKRAVRIVPLYWVATALLCAALFVMPGFVRTAELRADLVVKSFLFIPFRFTGQSGVTIAALYSLGWTLLLEVFFYVLFYLSMKVNHARRDVVCGALLLFFLAVPSVFGTTGDVLGFYSNPITLEFIFGMLSYRLLTGERLRSVSIRGSAFWGCLAVAVVLAGLLFWLDGAPLYGHETRPFVLGVPAFVLFLLLFKMFEHRPVPRALTFLGDVSFSLYLVHVYIVLGFSRLIYSLDNPSPASILITAFVLIPLIVLVSWISWYIMENKVSGWLRRKLLGR